MTPAWYVEVVVLPTVREFIATPDDNRLAYLSSIATYHVADYVMRANLPFGVDQRARETEIAAIRTQIKSICPTSFAIVAALCNGTKHCGCDRGLSLNLGDEEQVPAFAADVEGAGADEGRADRPGLTVVMGSGHGYFVDDCVMVVLRAFQASYPQHLQTVEIAAVS